MRKLKKAKRSAWVVYPELTDLIELTPIELLFLSYILYLELVQEGCFVSNSYLADRYNMSERQAKRIIKKIKEAGYITTILQKYDIASSKRTINTTNKVPKVTNLKFLMRKIS